MEGLEYVRADGHHVAYRVRPGADDRDVVLALGDLWGPARLCAAAHPDAIGALALYEPTGPTNPVALAPGVTSGAADWIAHICPRDVAS
jgi:hypothetical protein